MLWLYEWINEWMDANEWMPMHVCFCMHEWMDECLCMYAFVRYAFVRMHGWMDECLCVYEWLKERMPMCLWMNKGTNAYVFMNEWMPAYVCMKRKNECLPMGVWKEWSLCTYGKKEWMPAMYVWEKWMNACQCMYGRNDASVCMEEWMNSCLWMYEGMNACPPMCVRNEWICIYEMNACLCMYVRCHKLSELSAYFPAASSAGSCSTRTSISMV
jgi:hypothetical protein